MAITLAQAGLETQDKLSMVVIDGSRKSSSSVDHMTPDDCVFPVGGGATMTYEYYHVITPSTASFCVVSAEHTADGTKEQKYTTDIKIFGGTFETDRVIADMGGMDDEVTFQMQQKIKFTPTLFSETLIIDDPNKNEKSFDGLDMAITESSTEYEPSATIDLSTTVKVTENYQLFPNRLDEFLIGLDGRPGFIGGNLRLIVKIWTCTRRAGTYRVTKNDFGQQVENYGDIPLVGFSAKNGSNDPIVSIDTASGTKGGTSLYAAGIRPDGFHAVSPSGGLPIRQQLLKFGEVGAVKKGKVEILATAILKATKTASTMHKIKVQQGRALCQTK